MGIFVQHGQTQESSVGTVVTWLMGEGTGGAPTSTLIYLEWKKFTSVSLTGKTAAS